MEMKVKDLKWFSHCSKDSRTYQGSLRGSRQIQGYKFAYDMGGMSSPACACVQTEHDGWAASL